MHKYVINNIVQFVDIPVYIQCIFMYLYSLYLLKKKKKTTATKN